LLKARRQSKKPWTLPSRRERQIALVERIITEIKESSHQRSFLNCKITLIRLARNRRP
jgi:hypothetical protein